MIGKWLEKQRANKAARIEYMKNKILTAAWQRTKSHPGAPSDAYEYAWEDKWPAHLESFRPYFTEVVEASVMAVVMELGG